MIQLQPREIFTIVRQLPDPGDTGTYYVRASVYNSRTGELLKDINLVDRGGQRFTQDYQIPADVSGQGFYIDITTNVYTDSIYSVNSTIYGRDNNSYLVFDRISRLAGGGSGGGDIDYKKIQRLLSEFFLPFARNKDQKGNIIDLWPEAQKVDINPLHESISALHEKFDSVEPQENEAIDFAPVTAAISATEKRILFHIDEKEVTESTDLTPVLDAISEVKESVEKTQEEGLREMKECISKMEDMCGKYQDMFKENYPELSKNLEVMVKQLKEAVAYSTVLPKGEKPRSLEERARGL